MKTVPIVACIPCFNNARTLKSAIESLRAQTFPPAEIVVIDDGSTDDSAQIAGQLANRVIRHAKNLGRGAARARAIHECGNSDYLLFCDAGMSLAPDFLAKALRHVLEGNAAAAFGRVVQEDHQTPLARWRARHLFKSEKHCALNRQALLATGGALLNRNICLQVGNFDPALKSGEDADLGRRLLLAGHEVIFDPALTMQPLQENTLAEILERYARWNTSPKRRPRFEEYLKQISYAVKVMVREDLRRGDFSCAVISLICPHYQFWRTRLSSQNEP